MLQTGKRAVVYVALPDQNRPTYEGREIVLGPKASDEFIVVSGLKLGERVVTKGAFKIDSALQIQAKPSMMNPDGGGRTPGHNHGGSSAPASQNPAVDPHVGHAMPLALEIDPATAQAILPEYLKLQSALASDDLDVAKASLQAMMTATGHSGELPDLLHQMLGAADLNGVRSPYFQALSNALIAVAKSNPSIASGDLLLMHCPMAMEGSGADWLQGEEPLQNPYYGASMLRCGEVKEKLSSE